jgi:Alpha-kinase family
MRKFSGSNKAGANTDFAGQTCDAFAHFTLADSGMEFVPVDIQGRLLSNFESTDSEIVLKIHSIHTGIDMPMVVNGVIGANMITLLDIMAHRYHSNLAA